MLVRLHYLLLVSWVVFAIPSLVLLGLEIPIAVVVSVVGSVGMFGRRRFLVRAASLSLIGLMVGGKVGEDLLGMSAPDTAVLLVQFVAVILGMEASRVVLSFDSENGELGGKDDELSLSLKGRLVEWARGQLGDQARIMGAVLALSLVLLLVGGFVGISINQLGFSAALVVIVVGVLLFLVTNRREPEH